METLNRLSDLVRLVEHADDLFVRWSRGPAYDMRQGQSSRDELTGVPMPGLSANPLAVEAWWGSRPRDVWVARRLYDYRHLRHKRGPDVRPWVFAGEAVGRGPDNEPLVRCHRPVAWVADAVVAEADALVASQDNAQEWGPLDRGEAGGPA
jgi:hypothetical protein